MAIAKTIIDNIEQGRITDFISKQGVPEERNDKGKDKHLLLDELLKDNLIEQDALNEFLYDELMCGHRRLVRVYELKSARKIRKVESWEKLQKHFKIDSLDFNSIITTILKEKEELKIAAIKSEIENGILTRSEILFVFNMLKGSRKTTELEYVHSYVPVIFDFEKKTLMLKVWNREQGEEGYRPLDQLDCVFAKLTEQLQFETKQISNNPQNILYLMSKELFENFFNQLPNIADLETKKEEVSDIVNMLLSGIDLKNAEDNGKNITMNPEVINVEEEVYKLLQQIALLDHLKDNDIKTLLGNTDKYVSKIRFNDKDNLSASLTGEKGVKCIYDTKTFMCIRNSLDLVERIVAIVVTFVDNKKTLHAKYESVDSRFLNIHILNSKYYTQKEFEKIWELYKLYEAKYIAKNGNVYTENHVEAV